MNRIGYLFREETEGFHLRYLIARMLIAPLPSYTGERYRGIVFKLMGVRYRLRQRVFRGSCDQWASPPTG